MTVEEFYRGLSSLEDTKCDIEQTNEFKKNLRLAYKRGCDLSLLLEVIHTLSKHEELEEKYKAHVLRGKYQGVWECHVKSDWLFLWNWTNGRLMLILTGTGTHSDLF